MSAASDKAMSAASGGGTTGSLAAVCGVILDIDGVLLDARPSYHAVAEEAARRAIASLVGKEKARAVPFDREREVAAFKAAGHFNDDWEMSRGVALLLYLRALDAGPTLAHFLESARGEGVAGLYRGRNLSAEVLAALDGSAIGRTCARLYGGDRCKDLFGFDGEGPGYWKLETLLPEPALLAALSGRFRLALFTGRNPGEARLALELTGLTIQDELRWVADGRPRKPDPAGLIWLARTLTANAPPGAQVLFIGDTADDLAAARGARAAGAPIVYAHIEEPGDTNRVLQNLLRDTAGGSP